MILDFSWIKCFGEECILITDRENGGQPLLILKKRELDILRKEFKFEGNKDE